jgi:hypothetical protein
MISLKTSHRLWVHCISRWIHQEIASEPISHSDNDDGLKEVRVGARLRLRKKEDQEDVRYEAVGTGR